MPEDINEILKEIDEIDSKEAEVPIEQQTITVSPVGSRSAQAKGSEDKAEMLLNKLIENFGDMQGKIWETINNDRSMIDKYIELFTDRIKDPEQSKQAYIEALTVLVSNRANHTVSLARFFDSMTKMVAVAKGMRSNNSLDGINLENLLKDEQPAGFDPKNP